jgi:predicted NBD/HSP70 family sugar kinase
MGKGFLSKQRGMRSDEAWAKELEGRVIQSSIPGFHAIQRHAEDLRLGSIVVTKDSVFAAVGYCYPGVNGVDDSTISEPLSRVELQGSIEFHGSHQDRLYPRQRAVNESDIEHAARWIMRAAPLTTHICISSFGPFVRVGRKYRTSDPDNYGLYRTLSNYPEWDKKNLYKLLVEILERVTSENYESKRRSKLDDDEWTGRPEVLIGLDVNIAALGEHYYAIEDEIRADPTLKKLRKNIRTETNVRRKGALSQKMHARYAEFVSKARQSTAYVKISHSVNVGFTNQGWMSRGRSHAQMSVFRPRRSLPEHKITEQMAKHHFEGTCERHGDCIEGLVSVKAVIHQAEKKIGCELDQLTVESARKHLPLGDPIWSWSARYVGQLIYTVTALVAPRRVAIGGAVVRSANGHAGGWTEFVDMVRDEFVYELYYDGQITPVPNYPELQNVESFFSYRLCAAPGLYGGLIAARWDKTGRYPYPLEELLGVGRRKPTSSAANTRSGQ